MESILQFHWLMQENGEMKQKNYGHDSKLTSSLKLIFLMLTTTVWSGRLRVQYTVYSLSERRIILLSPLFLWRFSDTTKGLLGPFAFIIEILSLCRMCNPFMEKKLTEL
ncbi:hypothetical protein KU74_02180 [Pectobacterium brasiliense]|uniref:Uncharacterized protein n=1 Tax=Pectobacterium brasiliense TaxID=180957 RepID=A0A0M2F2S8_9GAMM|nr:hypothetical protein KU74_02180 [Pectobacterium brasiliense]KMK83254.1 hypothetical protein KCO_16682 [Pectobacterium brasiliense ICMP 19477]